MLFVWIQYSTKAFYETTDQIKIKDSIWWMDHLDYMRLSTPTEMEMNIMKGKKRFWGMLKIKAFLDILRGRIAFNEYQHLQRFQKF